MHSLVQTTPFVRVRLVETNVVCSASRDQRRVLWATAVESITSPRISDYTGVVLVL
jgi:hypothetical protein